VDLLKPTKRNLESLIVPRRSCSLRYGFRQLALAVGLWLALSPHSHAGWEIVPAHPVWLIPFCVANPYPPAGVNYTPEYKPWANCPYNEWMPLQRGVIAFTKGACGGQPGDSYGLSMTVLHWTGRIDTYDSRDFGFGCALTYQCKDGTGYNGGPNMLPPGVSPNPDSLLCRTWTPDPVPPAPPPPPPPPGGPVPDPDYYYIMLTDGSTYPPEEDRSGLRPLGTLELEPAQRTQPIFAYVYNGNTGEVVPGASVEIAATVSDESGGHAHLANRPKGDLIAIAPHTGTSGDDGVLKGTTAANGEMLFQFKAPVVAGDHGITARCTDRDCGEASGVILVGVKDLQSLSIHNYRVYKLVGQTGAHPDNHYLTLTADARVTVFAAMYQLKYPQRSVLHLNDASLERGGIFDIYPESSPNWKAPHLEHCRGTVIDIRANGADGALNITSDDDPMIQEIKDLGGIVGADPVWEVPKGNTGIRQWNLRHFHTRLMGQEGLQCP